MRNDVIYGECETLNPRIGSIYAIRPRRLGMRGGPVFLYPTSDLAVNVPVGRIPDLELVTLVDRSDTANQFYRPVFHVIYGDQAGWVANIQLVAVYPR